MNIILITSEYKLKYDSTDNKLRDLTSDEIKRYYGKGNKILCPCSNKEYRTQSFVASHMKTQKHQSWLNKEIIEYIQEYGHCCDAESIITLLRQQIRESKVMYANLSNAKIVCDKKIENAEQNIIELKRELEILKIKKRIPFIII